jgi:ankyrin repeat protein
MTELHMAAAEGDHLKVRRLLASGADVNAKETTLHNTPLHLAAYRGNLDTLRPLMAAPGVDVDAKEIYGRTPLHIAAGRCQEATRLLLAVPGVDANARDRDGYTPLHCAVLAGCLGAMRLLLAAHGVDMNAANAERKKTLVLALNLTKSSVKIEACGLLLDHGATANLNLLLECLKSHTSGEKDLVERLTCRLQLSNKLPGDAPLGDHRLLTLGVLQRDPRMHTQWARVDESEKEESALEWASPFLEEESETWKIGSWWSKWIGPDSEVPVSLHACRVDVAACSHPYVFRALNKNRNMELLSLPFVEAIIRHTWKDYMAFAFTDIILNVIFLSVTLYASVLVQAEEWAIHSNHHWWAAVVLGCGTGKLFVEEGSQLLCSFRLSKRFHGPVCVKYLKAVAAGLLSYMKDSFGYCIVLSISVKGWFALLSGDLDHEDRFWLALWFASLWLRVVYSLRVVEAVGTKLLPIFRAVEGTASFFLVVGFVLCAGVHAYYMLGVRVQPSPVYAAFLQVFRLGFLGDFDVFEFEGVDPAFVKQSDTDTWDPEDPDPSPIYAFTHIVFFIISMSITLILMNLLIGVLGAAYELEQQRASQIYLKHLAWYIQNARSLPWVKLCLWLAQPGDRPASVTPVDGALPGYLYFLARKGGTADTSPSTVRQEDNMLDAKFVAFQTELDAKLAPLKTELDARLAPLDTKMTAIADNLSKLNRLLALPQEKARLASSTPRGPSPRGAPAAA